MESPVEDLRLRVIFEDEGILSKPQKKQGLKRSWVLLKPYLRAINDVAAYLLHCFNLHDSCPNGIILYMDGFVLPSFESTAIFKDKDLIRVRKKGIKLLNDMKAIKGVETLIDDKIIEKQPLPSNIILLANEEYNKETGGYQSESEGSEYDRDVAEEKNFPVENAPQKDVISKKRKASSKVESSETKAKKQRHMTPESVQKKHVHQHEKIRTPEKKRKHKKESEKNAISHPEVGVKDTQIMEPASVSKNDIEEKRKHKKEGKKHAISHPEVGVKDTKILEPTSVSKKSIKPGDNREEIKQVSAEANEAKRATRSTRRKRLKRHYRKKELAEAAVKNHICEEQPVKEKPLKYSKTDSGSKVDVDTNIVEYQQADETSDADVDIVPVIVRPGHIRFTPTKAKDLPENQEVNGCGIDATGNGVWEGHSAKRNVWGGRNNEATKETFQWNGITNKRRGQKWGTEKQSTSSRNGSRDYDTPFSLPQHHNTSSQEGKLQESIHPSGFINKWNDPKCGDDTQPTSLCIESRDDNTRSSSEQLPSNSPVEFEKLAPLTDSPKAGDIIAYRLVELSSSWCPELSSFRVGKISWFQAESNRIMLVSDPDYPLNREKNMDDDHNDDDDDSAQPPDFSVYNEDGSLEIDFSSLVDVRVVKCCDPNQSERPETSLANGISVSKVQSGSKNVAVEEAQSGSKDVLPNSGNGELNAPVQGKEKTDVWEEISEALSAKKAKLMQEKEENPDKRAWSRRGSAIGPIMEKLRAQNAI